MVHRISFFILTIAFLLCAVSALFEEELIQVSFSYSGSTGPSHWGNLSPQYSECSKGKKQSPVNIIWNETVLNTNLKPLSKNYTAANATIINWGFIIGVHYDGNVGDIMIDDKKYTFKQMHWHTPSDHRFDGEQFPAELHLVHQADDGSVAVVAILYQYGKPDPLVSKVEKYLKELGNEKGLKHEGASVPVGMLNTNQIRRHSHNYFRYYGSFTTPPCTESVIWTVLCRVRSISKEQVEALRAPLESECKHNSRPVQPLDGRKIELYK